MLVIILCFTVIVFCVFCVFWLVWKSCCFVFFLKQSPKTFYCCVFIFVSYSLFGHSERSYQQKWYVPEKLDTPRKMLHSHFACPSTKAAYLGIQCNPISNCYKHHYNATAVTPMFVEPGLLWQ